LKSVYLAGQSGASGLVLRSLLQRREDLRLLPQPSDERAAVLNEETEFLNSADVVILCLPTFAVSGVVARIVNPRVKVVDNSSANRTCGDWVYGLPELDSRQRQAIRSANRVSSPGCFATGFVLALRPLVEWGIVDPAATICVQGMGGYSAGGKRMVQRFEDPGALGTPFVEIHALNLHHAQTAEMRHHTGLHAAPLFVPLIGNFKRGMVVSIPLPRNALRKTVSIASLREAFRERYAGERLVSVRTRSLAESSIALGQGIGPGVELYVEGNEEDLLLVARLDNLGKGGAIAALQNMNLLLGDDEFLGLESVGKEAQP
jgi:N-acetyl-gamma-glutamyl-phosphate reductase